MRKLQQAWVNDLGVSMRGKGERTLRQVKDGERLSGQGNKQDGYPSILISDGQGAGRGALICSLESFQWVNVVKRSGKVELWFEGYFYLVIPEGIVSYHNPAE